MAKCQSLYERSRATSTFEKNKSQFKLLGGQVVPSVEFGYMVQIIHIRDLIDDEPGEI